MILTDSPSADVSALDALCVDTLRFLSIDAVQKADSGHPGLPLGAAPMAYVLWTRHLKHHPANPAWFDRDRFVLSAGHGSMLLYSLLHVTGYDLPLDQIERFRQAGSLTPGHPERGLTPGVETTTGPLGQGFGNAVGMAMAEAQLAAHYNRPGFEIVDHHTYALVSDGDLMEGVAAEAASLAGHLRLGKLICLYDDNRVTLSAGTAITFTEDRAQRFDAYGWHTEIVTDGNDLAAIDAALANARAERLRPSLILVRTHLGYGSPNRQDTYRAHGSPLGDAEVRETKHNLGWPPEPAFHIPASALRHFRRALTAGRVREDHWNARFAAYASAFPELAKTLLDAVSGTLPDGWDRDIPVFPADPKGLATRVAAGKVLNAIAPRVPSLTGGSADLDPSTFTALTGLGDFEAPGMNALDRQGSNGGGWSRAGRNLHFGVREHAMGTILNGLAAHGGILPFGATFLIFSDYMRPPIRLAAMMHLRVIYVFTHDSLAVGEDGATHQPVEQLAGLRAIPGLLVIRPADANETAIAWRVALEARERPTALILTRQDLPTIDRLRFAPAEGLRRGGYILADAHDGRPTLILIATGSEVALALAAQAELATRGLAVRVVSLPCWRLFDAQAQSYRDAVLPPAVGARLAIEAGVTQGWHRYVGDRGDVLGVVCFGASAPGAELMRDYGFTVENVCDHALKLLA
jgi:transketolase